VASGNLPDVEVLASFPRRSAAATPTSLHNRDRTRAFPVACIGSDHSRRLQTNGMVGASLTIRAKKLPLLAPISPHPVFLNGRYKIEANVGVIGTLDKSTRQSSNVHCLPPKSAQPRQ
jgi:hypothetical protein